MSNIASKAGLDGLSETARTAIWIGLVVAAGLVFSFGFACAAPFAAMAAIAGAKMRLRPALLLIGAVWAVNQAVGFLFLHYPHDASTYGWGVAIGVACAAATLAARLTAARLEGPVGFGAAFIAAFAAEQAVFLVASAILPGAGAMAPAVVAEVFAINALAFAGLVVLRQAARALGLIVADAAERPAAHGA